MSIANSPRCGAKAKSRGGEPCLHAALANGRCYYHGGRNKGAKTKEGKKRQKMASWKHGYYSKESIEERRSFRETLKEFKDDIHSR